MSKCEKCIHVDKHYSTSKGVYYCSKRLNYPILKIRNNCEYFQEVKPTNFDHIKNMTVEEMARILFSLPHDEILKVKTSDNPGIDLLDVVNWLNSECEV